MFKFPSFTWGFGTNERSTSARSACSVNTTLFRLSKSETFDLAAALAGILVVGASGSGKTSGVGPKIALSYLQNGFGGLVLCPKPEERKLWQKYCKKAGREKDVIVFGPGQPYRFNFLDYAVKSGSGGAGVTENVCALLISILDIAERGPGQGNKDGDPFWVRMLKQLIKNAINLLLLSRGRLSIPEIYRIVISAPISSQQIKSDAWKNSSFCFQCLAEAEARQKTTSQKQDFELVADYFLLEFCNLSEKTRSIVVSSFTSLIDGLNRGILRDLFCSETNLTPDAVLNGKILILDISPKEYFEIGQISQVIWKYALHRVVEQRSFIPGMVPIFIWQDEAQLFLMNSEYSFVSTCRSAGVANVMMSQNISNFYAALGGTPKAKVEVDSLFGNLNSKFFCANSDPVTNTYASELSGKSRKLMLNGGTSHQSSDWAAQVSGFGNAAQSSSGMSEQLLPDFEPSYFSKLRVGGARNGWIVDAIFFQNGRRFGPSGKTWLPMTFKQEF